MSGNLPVSLGVGCYVAVYPYEGGSYLIEGDNAGLVGASVQKDITQPYGSFNITLAPGGPSGASFPTWTQLLTPQSFVLIGMRRGGTSQIVMMGIVLSCGEAQTWSEGYIQRATIVQGADISYLFSNASYYNLTFLFGLPTSALGGVGQLDALNQGLIQGSPASVGKAWYTNLMAGNNGVLSSVMFNRGGVAYPLYDVIATWFEEYPYSIQIPMGAAFLSSQGSWYAKFMEFFESPFYEFFVITAPQGTYPQAVSSDDNENTDGNATMTPSASALGSLGNYASAQTFLIARVNPFPYANNTGSVEKPVWVMDMSRWNALPRNSFTNQSFLSSNIQFSETNVRNFFLLNPIAMNAILSQSNTSPFVVSQNAWVDKDSLARYGYSPEIPETSWLFDQNGIIAQQLAAQGKGQEDLVGLINNLTYRIISQYLPTPLMGAGSVVIPLQPDMLPGTVFTYVPFKDSVTWDFYVQGVSHSYQFGGQSTTTLTLTRGLPSAVYQDSQGLLLKIFTAQAWKQNGVYQANPNALGLKAINFTNAAQSISAFGTLQGGVQPT